MADDPTKTGDPSDSARAGSPNEDAETEATREELKQTVISDKSSILEKSGDDTVTDAADQNLRSAADRPATPKLEGADGTDGDELMDRLASPKKKRAHDQVEEPETVEEVEAGGNVSEPEAKRPRDKDADESTKIAQTAPKSDAAKESDPSSKPSASTKDEGKPVTSSSAFASSGFAKLANSTSSPFGALAGGAKPSIFGGGGAGSSGSASPFGALGSTKSATPTLSFGSAANADKTGSASPFGALNGPKTTFGGGFGSAFGGAATGPRLTSFAKPGADLKSDKPAKPFGAPDSDAEQASDADSDEEDDASVSEAGKGEDKEKEGEDKGLLDDKKKVKLQRVVVDDGEAHEATILQLRAKIYYLDRELKAWKERGAGILKVNVPRSSVEFDRDGAVIPTSFDASAFDEEEEDGKPKVVRLLMRQDSTHRVLLNTLVLSSTDFTERKTLKGALIMLVAFEGDDAQPVSIQIKTSEANSKAFLSCMGGIQRELRGD